MPVSDYIVVAQKLRKERDQAREEIEHLRALAREGLETGDTLRCLRLIAGEEPGA